MEGEKYLHKRARRRRKDEEDGFFFQGGLLGRCGFERYSACPIEQWSRSSTGMVQGGCIIVAIQTSLSRPAVSEPIMLWSSANRDKMGVAGNVRSGFAGRRSSPRSNLGGGCSRAETDN